MSHDFYTHSILPHAGIIIKICRAYSNNEEDFQDYYQEVCLQLFKSKDNFKGHAQWSTWVYRLSLNVCLTLLKKDKKKKDQFITTDALPSPNQQDSPTFSDEDLNQLYKAIKQLNKADRAVIILFLENKKNKEIADILGISANNVGVRINRIKSRLEKIMKHNNYHG